MFRGHFSNSTKMSSKHSLFRGKFESKIARYSRLGVVFPGERKSHLGYVLKTSGHACVQHLYSSGPKSNTGRWYRPTLGHILAFCGDFYRKYPLRPMSLFYMYGVLRFDFDRGVALKSRNPYLRSFLQKRIPILQIFLKKVGPLWNFWVLAINFDKNELMF